MSPRLVRKIQARPSARGLLAVAMILLATGTSSAVAQTAPADPPKATSAAVPTTRILAIGTLTPAANDASLKATLKDEVRQTVRLYLDGKLDQWFAKQDNKGVVFILNVTDVEEARRLLEALPLGKAGLMKFELTPLGPLRPLGVLLAG